METNINKTPYELVINSGYDVLLNLSIQILNLIVELVKEQKKNNEEMEDKHDNREIEAESEGNIVLTGFTENALKTSIILLLFSFLEAYCNFIGELAVKTNEGLPGSPEVLTPLNNVENDYLMEKESFINPRNGEVSSKSNSFVPTMDKIALYPMLLGRIHNVVFRLNKGVEDWRNLNRLKEFRDAITHPKLNIHVNENDDNTYNIVSITNQDIYMGAECVIWYRNEIHKELLDKININEKSELKMKHGILESVWYLMLSNLKESCGINDRQFTKKYSWIKEILSRSIK